MFGFKTIKTNSGAIALLVRVNWVSVNAAIRILVRTKQADRDCKKDGSLSASKQTLVRFEWNMNATRTKYF